MEQALSGDLGWHAAMLLDEVRVGWFARGIAATVRPGDVVLDLGSGTGLLAMLAARAGARHVYAVEQSPIVAIAGELIRANRLDNRITIVHDLSFDLDLPERATVVVSETLGAWGADEGIAAIMADAAARLAVPGARLIPDSVTMWLAPVDAASPSQAPHLEALGLDMAPFFDRLGPASGTPGEGGQATIAQGRVIAPAQEVLRLTLGRDAPPHHAVTLEFPLPDGKAAGALAGWFTATAPGGPPLATGPSDPVTMWGQVLVPLPAPITGTMRVELDLTFERDGMGVDLQARPAGP